MGSKLKEKERMATYIVNAPNRHVVNVSCPLGSFQFNHASYMYNDGIARYFPHIFTKISEDSPYPQEPVVEPAPVVVEEVAAPVVERQTPEVSVKEIDTNTYTTPPVAAAPTIKEPEVDEIKVRKKPGPKPKVKVA
jgi:hypothetical protein